MATCARAWAAIFFVGITDRGWGIADRRRCRFFIFFPNDLFFSASLCDLSGFAVNLSFKNRRCGAASPYLYTLSFASNSALARLRHSATK
jgi:hypothetical protein